MTALDTIKKALALGDGATMMLVDDLRDAPLAQPTPRGGNHPIWILGHIAFTEAGIPSIFFGEPNPLEHWAAIFAPGTEPGCDPDAYPPLEELIIKYKELRARTLQLLDQIGEAGLDRKTKNPPKGLENALATFGDTFLTLAMHQMNHRGQLADVRRALGRKAIFTPGM
jgi:hypothetical protein